MCVEYPLVSLQKTARLHRPDSTAPVPASFLRPPAAGPTCPLKRPQEQLSSAQSSSNARSSPRNQTTHLFPARTFSTANGTAAAAETHSYRLAYKDSTPSSRVSSRSRDGSSLLPNLKEICDAVRADFDMIELMEETLGSAPQTVQPSGGSHWVEPVTQEEVTSLADAVKNLCLFFQGSVAKGGPPVEQKPFFLGVRPPPQGGSAGICSYFGEKGHYRSQCAELTTNLNGQRVHIWQGDFYFLGSREKTKGVPCNVLRAVNPEGPAQAKTEATSASNMLVGEEWCPPVVGEEVWVVKSDKRVMLGGLDQMDVDLPKKSKGKEKTGPSFLVPSKKKAAELAKRALGGESQVALSLKELATILPMMAEELILVIQESAGLNANGNHVSLDVRLGEVEPAAEVPPCFHSETVLCPLGYVQMCIGDCQVWEMIHSGSMVNLLSTKLVRDISKPVLGSVVELI
ncbi:hypothetical protein VP01_203g9 [Puccinia sorghi]|uniref:Uncharacterized protein n=1 Tax=Puccinia sorghi TaxID=27349 RepID=A0A0L6VAV9_9BASI|nr:hypothetical protein VP01_203g9 [Puccinia sorghi]